MENELLPCPFCGGEAEILTAESMHGGYLFGIMCNDCRSRGDVYDTEAEAIAAWNTRAEPTCVLLDHGKFMPHHEFYRVVCSECGILFWQSHGHLPMAQYCPGCGAKVVD